MHTLEDTMSEREACKGHVCPECGERFKLFLAGEIYIGICCTVDSDLDSIHCGRCFKYANLESRPYDDFADWVKEVRSANGV
jgi:hypothetical protein